MVFNPFLPPCEFIADGEPYVFDGRLYLYGSHDSYDNYCAEAYVLYSAPVDNLGDWRYEGEIYSPHQDPLYENGKRLFAPDIQKGLDGKYYLYYPLNGVKGVGVAVCDTPNGKFEYYGRVRYNDGAIYPQCERGCSSGADPAVFIDDDNRIFLYTGYVADGYSREHHETYNTRGAYCVELESDMLTVKGESRLICSGEPFAEGDFKGHGFYEASSMRKFVDKYYFIYSSSRSDDLCYAISDKPDGDFKFGGRLVSITDYKDDDNYTPCAISGNTHGSVVQTGEDYYVFYHRQTKRSSGGRQACAEKLVRNKDGSFSQATVTSFGLCGGVMAAKGVFPASTACNLIGDKIHFETQGETYLKTFDKEVCGFKYLDFSGEESSLSLSVKNESGGDFEVCIDTPENVIATGKIIPCTKFSKFDAQIKVSKGEHALFIRFNCSDAVCFKEFCIE